MSDVTIPSWVRKRDGRLVPFEADRICRALFAAGESIGQPDPFLARELADSVVHFLIEDCGGEIPTTQRIAEIVVQVVRELGQPGLARSFAAREQRSSAPVPEAPSLAETLAVAARHFTLQTVYTRELVAAQETGLITLVGLTTPGDLHGCVLGAPLKISGDLVADLEGVRRFAGQLVAVDGLEYLIQQSPEELAAQVARGLRLTGLAGVIALNCTSPPSWAVTVAAGPLFEGVQPRAVIDPDRSGALLSSLLPHLGPDCRVEWHLGVDDFASPRVTLTALSHALDGLPICIVFDRPRSPVVLAEGLDRGHPASLLVAGLNLPALLQQPGMLADSDRFLQRLGSLVRLGLSAAVQKRDYLRRERSRLQADVTSGFLLDRARFVVCPIGLDEVVTQFSGWSLNTGGAALELARRIVGRIQEVLRQEGRLAQIESCLDGPYSLSLEPTSTPVDRAHAAGVTGWLSGASVKSQIRAGTTLHGQCGSGTMALFLQAGEESRPEAVLSHLEQIWQQTDIVRVRLIVENLEQGELFRPSGAKTRGEPLETDHP